MKPSDEFFSGNRYAIFGVRARGRMQGSLLRDALVKAGKHVVAVEPEGADAKGTEVSRSLAEAGAVDGVILLPPTPWDDSAIAFTTDAIRQCAEQRITRLWIYTAGDVSAALSIAKNKGLDPVTSVCPCLHIPNGGFPHNAHRFICKLFGKL